MCFTAETPFTHLNEIYDFSVCIMLISHCAYGWPARWPL